MSKKTLFENKDKLLSYDVNAILSGFMDDELKISRDSEDANLKRFELINDITMLNRELEIARINKERLISDFLPDRRRERSFRANSDENLWTTIPVDTSLATEGAKIFVKNNSLFLYGVGEKNREMHEINIETGTSRKIFSASLGCGYANLIRIPNKNAVVINGGEEPSYGTTSRTYVHKYGEVFGSSTITEVTPSRTTYLSLSAPVKYREDECGMLFIGGYRDRFNNYSYSAILNPNNITSTALSGYSYSTYYKSSSNDPFNVVGGCANIISKEEAMKLYPDALFPSESDLRAGQKYTFYEYRFGLESASTSNDEAFARNKIHLLYEITKTDFEGTAPDNCYLYAIGDRYYEGHSDFEANFCDFVQIKSGETTFDIYLGYSKKEPVLQVISEGYYKRVPVPLRNFSYYIDEEARKAYMLGDNALHVLDLEKVLDKPKILYKKDGVYYKEDNNTLVSLGKTEVTEEDFQEHGADEINITLASNATVCSYSHRQLRKMKAVGKLTPQLIKQTKSFNIINKENRINIPILAGQEDIVKIAFSNNNGYSWRTIKDGEIEVMRIEDIATEGFSPEDASNLSRKKTIEMLSDKICFAYYIDNNNDKVTICPPIISNSSNEAVYYGENKNLSYEAPYIKKVNEDIPELGFISVVPTMSDVTMSSAEVTEVIDEEEKTYAITKIDIPSIADLKSYYITVKNIEEE